MTNDQHGEDLPDAWPAEWMRALGDDSLTQASSDAIFQRGRVYAASGAVRVISEDPMPEPALCAQVLGTKPYTTEVWIEDDDVAGSCDCPNAADGWFCKHQVAVSIVWRSRLTGDELIIDEEASKKVRASAKRAQTVKDKRTALHDFLRGQDPSALVEKLMEIADRDRDIARELQHWRKVTEVTEQPAELKSLVTQLLSPGRSFIAWNETYRYVRRAESVLPLLRQTIARDAEASVALCLHALRRGWSILQQADDSDGDIGGLCEAIGAEWVRSLQAAGPRPAKFGETYLQVQLDDPFGSFEADTADVAIGEPAMERYRRALADRWRKAKDAVLAVKVERIAKEAARKGGAPFRHVSSGIEVNLWTLERLHLHQLESAGRVDEALAVLCEDLSMAEAHGTVVSFLEKYGRHREAHMRAEQGLKAFPDDWHLQEAILRCYERDGWTAEALGLRQKQFEQRPGVECYHLVLKAGRAAGQDVVALRQELIEFMTAQEGAPRVWTSHGARFGPVATTSPTGAGNVSLRAEILCSEGLWVEACALVQPPAKCDERVLSHVARHLPAEQNEQALSLFLQIFDRSMQKSSSPYANELALVEEIGARMDPVGRSAWLAQLRAKYKAKRNFVRALPER